LLFFCVLRIHSNPWVLAALSGILQVLIFPLPGLYFLAWIAFVPLLVAILQARRSEALQLPDARGVKLIPASFVQAFLLGYFSGFIWYAGTCYWVYSTMHQYGGLSTLAGLGVLVLFCLYLGLYHGVFAGLLRLAADPARSVNRRALVMAPFLWVAVELARTRITGFPWNLLGTCQVDNIPLARITTVTGVYGVSFEIFVVNTALAAAFLVKRNRRATLVIAALSAALVLQMGNWIKPASLVADRSAVLLQENVPILDSSDWTKDLFQHTLDAFTGMSEAAVNRAGSSEQRRPDLIVWPESPAPFYTGDPLFRDSVSGLAKRSQTWVLVGSLGVRNATEAPQQGTQVFNSGALVSPAGAWTARYDKVHLVPFGEYLPFRRLFWFAAGLTKEVGDFSRGVSRAPLTADDKQLGVFICYESVFPDEIRRFARDGAQVFVNISNDGWYGDSGAYAQHLAQARMRAVENSRWLLRSTNTGVTAAIDPYGRIVATVPRKTRTTLVAPYAITNVTTFYTRHGDWFAYVCAIISLGALLMRFSPAKKGQKLWWKN
jgi:apolipoprotein N-acyltransferase